MQRLRALLRPFPAILLVVNVLGLVWIHKAVTNTSGASIRVLSALPARDGRRDARGAAAGAFTFCA